MIRFAVIVVLTLSTGVAFGVACTQRILQSRIESAQEIGNQFRMVNAQLEKEGIVRADELRGLANENATLLNNLDVLRFEMAALRDLAYDARENNPEGGGANEVSNELVVGVESASESRDRVAIEDIFSQPVLAQRQALSDQHIDRIMQTINEQLKNETDTQARESIQELAEYQTYIAQLQNEMRSLENDGERRLVSKELHEANAIARQIQTELRDYMLRRVASKYGISNPGYQESFLQDLQRTVRNPLFASIHGF